MAFNPQELSKHNTIVMNNGTVIAVKDANSTLLNAANQTYYNRGEYALILSLAIDKIVHFGTGIEVNLGKVAFSFEKSRDFEAMKGKR